MSIEGDIREAKFGFCPRCLKRVTVKHTERRVCQKDVVTIECVVCDKYLGAYDEQPKTANPTFRAMPLTDNDPMPFGKFKNEAMKNVPASYLDWVSGQSWISDWPAVAAYIEANRKDIDKVLECREQEDASGEPFVAQC